MFGFGAGVPAVDIETVKAFFRDEKKVQAAIKSYEQAATAAHAELEALKVARQQVDAMRQQQEVRLVEREAAFAESQRKQEAALAAREVRIREIERAIGAFTGYLDTRWGPSANAVMAVCEKALRLTAAA